MFILNLTMIYQHYMKKQGLTIFFVFWSVTRNFSLHMPSLTEYISQIRNHKSLYKTPEVPEAMIVVFGMALQIQPGKKMFDSSQHVYLYNLIRKTVMFAINI